ncbi:amino acid permease [Haloferax larsenii]|uniref:Amino acid permease n=1 Tax=Haloferax larsenii TaxID=302484 RepID=A0ABY5RB24_HALLR|nr:amino acid permease [Haloferax larsenii]ELZ82144.1 amino acid transporter [Haloferax larsenii JCM 13917]UVE49522.1 amino acid permease [Haloferax larsenii]
MTTSDEELAKDLGLLAALTIGVGTMIGAGIFVLPGEAAAAAGPAVALSFVIGGGISLFTALSASELGTAMPKAGGSYYYVNHALGPLFGSIAGWGNWIGLAFASAFYTLGFGEYLSTFLPLPALALGPLSLTPFQVGALLAGTAFITVNYVGAKETGNVQIVIVTILVAILTVFSVLGMLQADLTTLRPFFPPETGGATAVLPATGLVFVSFLGFAKITTVAEELRNPGRNLPLAVVGSVVIVTLMYALIMVVLMGVVNWRQLAPEFTTTPVLDVADIAFGTVGLATVGVGLLTFAGLLATASSANASILAASRINFAMGRDKLVSDTLNAVHPSFATPYRSIVLTGALILLFVVLGDIKTLAKAGSVLHLIVYGLLNIALIVMREADVESYQPEFEVPLYPVVPVLGALTSFGLIAFMEPIEIGLSLVFVAGGVVWYVVYARNQTEKRGILNQHIISQSPVDAAVSVATSVQPNGGRYRVMVPVADPEHEKDLITLASAIAKQHGGIVDAIHIVTVPDQTALAGAAAYADELDETSEQLLDAAREDAETFGVPVETHTIISHRSFEEIFDAARSHQASLVVMEWGDELHGSPGRVESAIDDLAMDLPCDFLVLKDRGFDPEHILVPTAGGPDSDLSAAVASDLRAEYGSQLTLLHVADSLADGEAFLESWAHDHDLGDAEFRVETGDVETAIEAAAEECSMVIVGATEEGLLSRLVRGAVVVDIVDDVDCSVLLAERARTRGLVERLFG